MAQCIVLALMWMTGCPQTSGAASIDAGPAAAPAPPPTGAPDTLADLVRIFPHGQVSEVAGPASLRAHLGDLLEAMVAQGNEAGVPIAFVVDRAQPENIALALELALAGNRAKLARGFQFALVSHGSEAGMWSARVERPLTADPYEVLLATGQVRWTPDERSGASSWAAGLQETLRLGWREGGRRPQIVLLTDDRPRREVLRPTAHPPPIDAKAWTAIAEWARATNATLHAVRCRLDLMDGQATGPDARPSPGVPLDVVAGLFRDGRHIRADSPGALSAALEDALARAASAGAPAEVALAVDRTGLMGAALGALSKRPSPLERFLMASGHRIALIPWGDGAAVVTAGLTSRKNQVLNTLSALRAGLPGDEPKNLFKALQSAQGLEWTPAARKSVIVLTAAPSGDGITDRSLLEWADAAAVAVTIIEPGPGARAPAPAR